MAAGMVSRTRLFILGYFDNGNRLSRRKYVSLSLGFVKADYDGWPPTSSPLDPA